MKARDIIPGWPRGKSTTQPYPVHRFESMLTLYFYEQVEQAKEYGRQVDAEDEENRHYHAEQQFMVDEYLGHGWFWRRYMLEACFEPTNRTASGCNLR